MYRSPYIWMKHLWKQKTGNQMAPVASREVTVVADGQEGDLSLLMSVSLTGKKKLQ